MSKTIEEILKHCWKPRIEGRNQDYEYEKAKAEIKQAILEAVGEDEEIIIPKGWDKITYDSEISPRNELRKEIKERIEKLFE